MGLEAELRPSPSPLPPCPGVHIQSSQIVESSGLYTLRSVLKAQLTKEDKDAQFYCELSYRLPSGNHMKESREVTVPVFCEYTDPSLWGWVLLALGLRAAPFACADPAERVWLEVEPEGMLKEGDRVEIRCLADGNPPPHFSIGKQVRGPLFWVQGGSRSGWRRTLITPLSSRRTSAPGRWRKRGPMTTGSWSWSPPGRSIAASTNVRAWTWKARHRC